MGTYDPNAWQGVPGFANSFDRYGWVDYRQHIIDWSLALKPAPASILDVGCCQGQYLQRLREQGFAGQLVGVDVTQQCVDAAVAAGLDVRRADCRSLPFVDKEFDTVLFLNVLMHLPEPRAPLAEACRVAGRHMILSCYGSPDVVRSRNTRKFLNTFYPKQAVLDAMPPGWKLADFAEFINPFGDPVFQYRFVRDIRRRRAAKPAEVR
jgi:SAM-dependent methyltransferase